MSERWLSASLVLDAVRATTFAIQYERERMELAAGRLVWWKPIDIPPSILRKLRAGYDAEKVFTRLWAEAVDAIAFLPDATIKVDDGEYTLIKDHYGRLR